MKHRCAAILLSVALACSLGSVASAAVTPGASASASSVTGGTVVQHAMRFLHDRYSLRGDSPKTGFSCIGFVSYVFRGLGIDMPGYLQGAMASYPRIRESQLEPGDIVFFKNTWWKGVSHVAIYIGDGRVIHAENFHRGVNISSIANDPLEGNYWQHHYLVAERPLSSNDRTSHKSSYPKASGTAQVTVSSLNLRAHHSRQSIVVTVLPENSQLSVYKTWHDWTEVSTGDVGGWVVSDGITQTSGTVSGSTGQGGGSGGSHKGKKVTVTVPSLHLRAGPSTSDSILETLSKGDTGRLEKSAYGWDKIKVSNLTGWAIDGGLTVSKGKSGGKKTSGSNSGLTPSKTYSVVPGVNIHSGAAVTDSVVGVTTSGTRVSVKQKKSGFAKVHTKHGLTGWMETRFVKGLKRGSTSTSSRHGHKKGQVTTTAHLRSKPSLSATILKWVQAGTKVTVLKTQPQWDKVRLHSGRVGYIYSQFVAVK